MPDMTIMVVDDSATIRRIMQRELAKADYEVILAKNGMEALAILEWSNPPPDLITLDIDMPKMNGFELCEKIRANAMEKDERKQLLAKIPMIFVSANDTLENRERGYTLEVIDFIGKPFSPGKVIATVNNILRSQEQFGDMNALIAEDSPVIRRIVRNILARHGLTIYEASNGQEALDIVKNINFSIDIVITDYLMPGMSGEELCRTLRSFESLEQVPIFFISTIDTKDAVLGFFKVGASDYLHKPFIEEEFRARIVTHLRNRKYVNDLVQLNNKLKYYADHDSLTGTHNRGYFTRKLTSCFTYCKNTDEDLCCILMDLDYFKRVNDDFGHAFGDLVLADFAKIVLSCRRDTDITARYGGEEFVLLLPNTNLADCLSTAEEIRKKAEGYYYNDGEAELQVTVSLGVASLQDHKPENPDRFLMMADEALYKAKESGRNRVVLYSR